MTSAKKTTKAQLCRRCLIVTKKKVVERHHLEVQVFSSLKRSKSSRECYHYIFDPDNCGSLDVIENATLGQEASPARDLGRLRNDKFKGHVPNSPRKTSTDMQRFRASTRLGDRLAETLALLPTEALWPEEKASVWENRVMICDSDPDALLKFLESVNWLQSSKREEAIKLMLLVDNIDLLVFWPRICRFYRSRLPISVFGASNMPSWLIVMLLPQLVQALKAESFEYSSLLYFLSEQAIEDFDTIGLSLHWLFIVEAYSASQKQLRHSGYFERSLDRFQCLLELSISARVQRILWAFRRRCGRVQLAISSKEVEYPMEPQDQYRTDQNPLNGTMNSVLDDEYRILEENQKRRWSSVLDTESQNRRFGSIECSCCEWCVVFSFSLSSSPSLSLTHTHTQGTERGDGGETQNAGTGRILECSKEQDSETSNHLQNRRRFETGFCRVEHTSNDGSTLVVQRLGSNDSLQGRSHK